MRIKTIYAALCLSVILFVFMTSAVLLLEPGIEPDAVYITLQGVLCMLIMAVASEVLIIALIVLLLFGGKKIPELMKGLGKGVRSFKDGMKGLILLFTLLR